MKDEKQMTNTLVSYPANVQEKINNLVAENYALDDMYEFISEHGNDNFVEYYEEFVAIGEDYSYEAVDTFIEEFGIQSLSKNAFEDSYRGVYEIGRAHV